MPAIILPFQNVSYKHIASKYIFKFLLICAAHSLKNCLLPEICSILHPVRVCLISWIPRFITVNGIVDVACPVIIFYISLYRLFIQLVQIHRNRKIRSIVTRRSKFIHTKILVNIFWYRITVSQIYFCSNLTCSRVIICKYCNILVILHRIVNLIVSLIFSLIFIYCSSIFPIWHRLLYSLYRTTVFLCICRQYIHL